MPVNSATDCTPLSAPDLPSLNIYKKYLPLLPLDNEDHLFRTHFSFCEVHSNQILINNEEMSEL
jgi:hypothetical protein